MMMNIRGLIMDDPGHTVHLENLYFALGGSGNRRHCGIVPHAQQFETLSSSTVDVAAYEIP